ncbi:MAG: helix-turn-helix transcriptional regulator [Bdellovibrionota bacterium]|nr:helix-turn-helix transcriptional regulator [Bdellovibrionota bacterium]
MARTAIKEVRNVKQKKLAANFRNNVVATRKKMNLRQIDVAENCSLSVKYIADIEQGKSGNPTLETICEVAKGLGVKDPLTLLKEKAK